MAIIIHCPYCHQPLKEMRQDCAHCHSDLPAGVVYALAAAFGQAPLAPPAAVVRGVPAQQQQPLPAAAAWRAEAPPVHNSPLRPWLAATLSLLCGLGQLYNGQIVKGAVLLMLATVALLSFSLLPGKLLAIGVWSYALIDAFVVARRPELPPDHSA